MGKDPRGDRSSRRGAVEGNNRGQTSSKANTRFPGVTIVAEPFPVDKVRDRGRVKAGEL